jgi:hypothetical protein
MKQGIPMSNITGLGSDIKTGFELAAALSELRTNETLSNLYYTQEVMRAIKRIPKAKPPTRTIKLSELTPTVEEKEEAVEEEKEQPSWLTKARLKVRRKKK